MTEEPSQEQREHELTLHVFSISAALVGVCLIAIGILRLVAAQTKVLVDILFMVALVVIVCICAIIAYALV